MTMRSVPDWRVKTKTLLIELRLPETKTRRRRGEKNSRPLVETSRPYRGWLTATHSRRASRSSMRSIVTVPSKPHSRNPDSTELVAGMKSPWPSSADSSSMGLRLSAQGTPSHIVAMKGLRQAQMAQNGVLQVLNAPEPLPMGWGAERPARSRTSKPLRKRAERPLSGETVYDNRPQANDRTNAKITKGRLGDSGCL